MSKNPLGDLRSLAALLVIAAISFAHGQTLPTGLDALNDDALYGELARLGQDSLLERAMAVNNVSPEKQRGLRALIALRQLADPASKLNVAQRAQLLQKISSDLKTALPAMTDPRVLMQQAAVLINEGLTLGRDANTLEYWGENPAAQAKLRPVAQTVIAVLDRCTTLANARADAIANTMKTADSPQAAEWIEMDKLAKLSEFTSHMADYYLVLSMPKSEALRKQNALAAIEYLKQFDNPESNVQANVRGRIGKLYLLAGDYASAQKMLDSLAHNDAGAIVPKPSVDQEYEARYFLTVCDLLSGNPDGAEKRLGELRAWQAEHIPANNRAWQQGAKAAAAVMEYRIVSTRGEKAKDDSQKQKFNDQAVAILLALLKERPEYRGVIYEQLSTRLPEEPQLAKLDPLLLQAITYKGELERLKDENAALDTKALEQALAAAQELIHRQAKGEITADVGDNAALLVPFFLLRLGRDIQAGEAFFDYAEHRHGNMASAQIALDNGLAIVGRLRKLDGEDAEVQRLYATALKTAISAPFERKEFAYEYARLLIQNGKGKEATEYLKQVPADDPRNLEASFLRMVAMKEQLDSQAKGAGAEALRGELRKMTEDIATRSKAALAAANSDQQRLHAQSLIAKTILVGADVANTYDKDPQRALKLLDGFETTAQGLAHENELLGEALFLRVDSYMDLGQDADATAALVELLKGKAGDKGANIIYSLLQRLDRDLEAARKSGDVPQMRLLARSRAQLSGYLLNWAASNTDPRIKQFTYRYRVFDAGTQLLAAKLENDPALRRKGLEAGLAKYQSLLTPAFAAEYRQTLQGGSIDENYPDPAATFGVGAAQFELGNYRAAQEAFGKLLVDRKLGGPEVQNDRSADNELYWEATYKLIRSNLELAKSDSNNAAANEENQNYLKRLYIQWGAAAGGRKWHGEFESLRKQIVPDFTVAGFDVPTTAPAGR